MRDKVKVCVSRSTDSRACVDDVGVVEVLLQHGIV